MAISTTSMSLGTFILTTFLLGCILLMTFLAIHRSGVGYAALVCSLLSVATTASVGVWIYRHMKPSRHVWIIGSIIGVLTLGLFIGCIVALATVPSDQSSPSPGPPGPPGPPSCPDGQYWDGEKCVPGCQADGDCAKSETCRGGTCCPAENQCGTTGCCSPGDCIDGVCCDNVCGTKCCDASMVCVDGTSCQVICGGQKNLADVDTQVCLHWYDISEDGAALILPENTQRVYDKATRTLSIIVPKPTSSQCTSSATSQACPGTSNFYGCFSAYNDSSQSPPIQNEIDALMKSKGDWTGQCDNIMKTGHNKSKKGYLCGVDGALERGYQTIYAGDDCSKASILCQQDMTKNTFAMSTLLSDDQKTLYCNQLILCNNDLSPTSSPTTVKTSDSSSIIPLSGYTQVNVTQDKNRYKTTLQPIDYRTTTSTLLTTSTSDGVTTDPTSPTINVFQPLCSAFSKISNDGQEHVCEGTSLSSDPSSSCIIGQDGKYGYISNKTPAPTYCEPRFQITKSTENKWTLHGPVGSSQTIQQLNVLNNDTFVIQCSNTQSFSDQFLSAKGDTGLCPNMQSALSYVVWKVHRQGGSSGSFDTINYGDPIALEAFNDDSDRSVANGQNHEYLSTTSFQGHAPAMHDNTGCNETWFFLDPNGKWGYPVLYNEPLYIVKGFSGTSLSSCAFLYALLGTSNCGAKSPCMVDSGMQLAGYSTTFTPIGAYNNDQYKATETNPCTVSTSPAGTEITTLSPVFGCPSADGFHTKPFLRGPYLGSDAFRIDEYCCDASTFGEILKTTGLPCKIDDADDPRFAFCRPRQTYTINQDIATDFDYDTCFHNQQVWESTVPCIHCSL